MSLIESAPLREWGTRYDSLSTSPSPSTASSLSRIPPTTTGTSTTNSSLLPPVTVTPTQTHTQSDKVSHEASVFVGSLPTTVDHAELSARLKDHLSAFVHVNLVRIIRDSRGGVCAFVQCNDSTAAAQLIQKVRSLPPQNFMGRHLRFEPARSQRTLWVSYRKPVEVIRDSDNGRFVPFSNSNGRIVEFDLPKAMRICRTPGARRINIFYNAQALHLDRHTSTLVLSSPQEQDLAASALTGVGLILSPLRFDSQTLHCIASSFGPLESFDLRPPEEGSTEHPTYPYPHNAGRSEGMDLGCWEIKWVNRNDCLSALATLRSVPHLTVTWPNQQHALIPRRSGPFNRSHQMKDHLATKRQSGLQQVHSPHGDDDNMSLCPSSFWNHRADTVAATLGSQSPSARLSPSNIPITTDDWTVVDTGSNTDFNVLPNLSHRLASEHLQSHACDVQPETEDNQKGQSDELICIDGVPPDSIEWSGIVVSDNATHSKDEITTSSPVSPFHAPVHSGNTQSPPPGSVTALNPPFIENLASPFVPKSLEPAYPLAGSAFNLYDSLAIPPAPHWSEARPRGPTGAGDENIDINLRNVLDPTTIFVGGLDVHGRCTWDEQRLKRVFGQYGEIVEVNLVRPAHRKSAFAFVTYKNNKSSSRAVLAEHGRIYDGRHIRVQLRDSAAQKAHGSKSNLKLSEGRPFSPRHQIGPRINGSPVDPFPHGQNGIRPSIPVPGDEMAPALHRPPSGGASLHPDTRGQAPDSNYVPLIPSQASSTMISGAPPMTYPPPPPPTAFYAPAPWFVHPYPYVPPPHIVPGYPPIPLTSSVVTAPNEASQPIPSNTMYQPVPHYSVYPLPLPPVPPARQQQHVEAMAERRAPLQPTGFIESEQGLIPVYAPEALGEYMASTNPQQNTPEPGGSQPVQHPPKMVPETRSSQPRAMYTMYPQPQYHPTFVRERGAVMMAAPSQFPNVPNVMPFGTSFHWYHDTIPAEYRAQEGPRIAAPHAFPMVETHQGIHMGHPLQGQIHSERGFGFSRRRGQMDRSTYARTTRGSNAPGMHTRRKGYFKHAGGAVSMSAVTDQTSEISLGDVASVAEPVVRASTSSPAVFDLTSASPKR